MAQGEVYFGFESLSVSTSAVPLTLATYKLATVASIYVEGAPVRFRLDGSAPTATAGDLLNIGDRLELDSHGQINSIQFISKDGATATLRCSYGLC